MRSLNTSALSEADRTVYERSTWQWTGTLRDQDGAAIGSADMTSVTCTVADVISGTKLVDGRDVKNANSGTLSAGGVQTVLLAGADNKVVDHRLDVETHRVTLDYTWAAGARRHWHVIEVLVVNHPDIR